jgi:hypothetical protein
MMTSSTSEIAAPVPRLPRPANAAALGNGDHHDAAPGIAPPRARDILANRMPQDQFFEWRAVIKSQRSRA